MKIKLTLSRNQSLLLFWFLSDFPCETETLARINKRFRLVLACLSSLQSRLSRRPMGQMGISKLKLSIAEAYALDELLSNIKIPEECVELTALQFDVLNQIQPQLP